LFKIISVYLACACLSVPQGAISGELIAVLKEIDRTEFSATGSISYRSDLGSEFRFWLEDGRSFPVVMDAGRRTRERVEAECKIQSMFTARTDACSAKVTGLLLVDGTRLVLSLDDVELL